MKAIHLMTTGAFVIFTASNAGSELFLSTDENPARKTMISFIDGGFPTDPFEFDR